MLFLLIAGLSLPAIGCSGPYVQSDWNDAIGSVAPVPHGECRGGLCLSPPDMWRAGYHQTVWQPLDAVAPQQGDAVWDQGMDSMDDMDGMDGIEKSILRGPEEIEEITPVPVPTQTGLERPVSVPRQVPVPERAVRRVLPAAVQSRSAPYDPFEDWPE